MSPKTVLMVDPGNYTPYYDVNLCIALSELGWNVEWLTSPYLFEPIAAPSNLRVRHLFLRGVTAVARRLPRVFHVAALRRGLKAASYPLDLVQLDRELSSRPAGVLHIQWALFPTLDAFFWKRWQGRGWRIVYTAHDVDGLEGTTPRFSSAPIGISSGSLTLSRRIRSATGRKSSDSVLRRRGSRGSRRAHRGSFRHPS